MSSHNHRMRPIEREFLERTRRIRKRLTGQWARVSDFTGPGNPPNLVRASLNLLVSVGIAEVDNRHPDGRWRGVYLYRLRAKNTPALGTPTQEPA